MFPPPAQTNLQKVIASYLYVQYNDDPSLQAFVDAQNQLAQNYLDTLNDLNLPIYTGAVIAGPLLDWVALGLYGPARPTLPAFGAGEQGEYNTFTYNTLVYSGYVPAVTPATFTTTDDIFKRILTWHFFKGDGQVFNTKWLKRRIYRFLNGPNGIAPLISTMTGIDVAFTAPGAITITLATTASSSVFQAAVASGALELPFQYTWTVTLI